MPSNILRRTAACPKAPHIPPERFLESLPLALLLRRRDNFVAAKSRARSACSPELLGSRFGVRNLGEADAHLAETLFAANGYVCNEKILVAAFLHVSLHAVVCPPWFFQHNYRDRGVRFAVET